MLLACLLVGLATADEHGPKLELTDIKERGAKFVIQGSNRETALHGDFVFDEVNKGEVKVNFKIKIGGEINGMPFGEAYLGDCGDPKYFDFKGKNIDGTWAVKLGQKKIMVFHDAMPVVNYHFGESECSQGLEKKRLGRCVCGENQCRIGSWLSQGGFR